MDFEERHLSIQFPVLEVKSKVHCTILYLGTERTLEDVNRLRKHLGSIEFEPYFKAQAGDLAWFGKNKDILVQRLEYHFYLQAMHTYITHRCAEINMHTSSQFLAYNPHVTLKDKAPFHSTVFLGMPEIVYGDSIYRLGRGHGA